MYSSFDQDLLRQRWDVKLLLAPLRDERENSCRKECRCYSNNKSNLMEMRSGSEIVKNGWCGNQGWDDALSLGFCGHYFGNGYLRVFIHDELVQRWIYILPSWTTTATLVLITFQHLELDSKQKYTTVQSTLNRQAGKTYWMSYMAWVCVSEFRSNKKYWWKS